MFDKKILDDCVRQSDCFDMFLSLALTSVISSMVIKLLNGSDINEVKDL